MKILLPAVTAVQIGTYFTKLCLAEVIFAAVFKFEIDFTLTSGLDPGSGLQINYLLRLCMVSSYFL